MRKTILSAALLVMLPLSGCAGSSYNFDVATPNQEYIALNAYDVAVKTANHYVRLPLCPIHAPVCRTQELSQRVYTALKSARVAKEQVLKALGNNAPLPLTAVDTLKAAYAVIQQIPKN